MKKILIAFLILFSVTLFAEKNYFKRKSIDIEQLINHRIEDIKTVAWKNYGHRGFWSIYYQRSLFPKYINTKLLINGIMIMGGETTDYYQDENIDNTIPFKAHEWEIVLFPDNKEFLNKSKDKIIEYVKILITIEKKEDKLNKEYEKYKKLYYNCKKCSKNEKFIYKEKYNNISIEIKKLLENSLIATSAIEWMVFINKHLYGQESMRNFYNKQNVTVRRILSDYI